MIKPGVLFNSSASESLQELYWESGSVNMALIAIIPLFRLVGQNAGVSYLFNSSIEPYICIVLLGRVVRGPRTTEAAAPAAPRGDLAAQEVSRDRAAEARRRAGFGSPRRAAGCRGLGADRGQQPPAAGAACHRAGVRAAIGRAGLVLRAAIGRAGPGARAAIGQGWLCGQRSAAAPGPAEGF